MDSYNVNIVIDVTRRGIASGDREKYDAAAATLSLVNIIVAPINAERRCSFHKRVGAIFKW